MAVRKSRWSRKANRPVLVRKLHWETLEERRVMAYADVVLGDGPTMYLRLDDAAGTNANDASPNNLDGTYSNFVAGDFAQAGGLVNDTNTAANFDGADNFVALPTAAFGTYPATSSNFSFEVWFKTTSAGVILGNTASPSTPGGGNPGGFVPAIYVDSAGYLRESMFWHGGVGLQNISSAPVNDGQWHHVLVTYTGGGASGVERLYLDGNFQDDQTVAQSNYAGNYNYFLGTGYTSSWANTNGGWYFFNGQLDEAASYNRVLSEQEIRQHYISGQDAFQITVAPAANGQEGAAYSRTATIIDQEPAIAYGALLNQAGVTGITGSLSVGFDGVNDEVVAPDLARSTSLRQRTVSGWFNTSSLAAGFQAIFYKGTEDACCANREMALFLTSAGSFHFASASPGQGQTTLDSPAFAVPNTWYQYSAVIDADAGQMRLYVNGALIASGGYSGTGMQDRADPWMFGNNANATRYPFKGQQDEIAIFNRALTPAEISDLASPSANYATRVLAKNPGQYFRFDETSGNRLNDQVQNSDTASATFGDGHTSPTSNVTPTARSVTFTNTYDDSGSYPLAITATNTSSHGLAITRTFTSLINNVAPVPTITGGGVGTPGFPISLTFAATDISAADVAAMFNLSINWGDGSPVQTFPANSGAPFAVTHSYANFGNYNVQLTAVDKDAGSATATKAVKITNVAVDANGNLQVVGTTAADRITLSPGYNNSVNVRFGNLLTVVPNFPGDIYIYGKQGADTISATQLTRRIFAYGDAGNDYIATVGGDDHLEGGPDNDRLLAGNGTNTVLGNDGNDFLQGGTGTDYLYGGAGTDTLNGMNGDDFLFGEDGKDTLNGSNGNDFLHGGAGLDLLGGDAGDDILIGGADSDKLYGRAGRDILIGGLALDQLLGGADDDILIGDSTIYDNQPIATNLLITTIRPTWSAAANIDAGILALTGLLGTAQIPPDNAKDVVSGEGDNDWFLYYFGLEQIKDQKANDRAKLL